MAFGVLPSCGLSSPISMPGSQTNDSCVSSKWVKYRRAGCSLHNSRRRHPCQRSQEAPFTLVLPGGAAIHVGATRRRHSRWCRPASAVHGGLAGAFVRTSSGFTFSPQPPANADPAAPSSPSSGHMASDSRWRRHSEHACTRAGTCRLGPPRDLGCRHARRPSRVLTNTKGQMERWPVLRVPRG